MHTFTAASNDLRDHYAATEAVGPWNYCSFNPSPSLQECARIFFTPAEPAPMFLNRNAYGSCDIDRSNPPAGLTGVYVAGGTDRC